MARLRVLELYSGIGGMHFALKDSCVPADVIVSVDINPLANHVYRHNFPDTPLWNKTIEGIPLDDFNKLSFDMILMSPPCQPFTRIGLQGDITDRRTKSFLHILHLLPRLTRPPRYILLENVKGFEVSCARERLVQTLVDCGYRYQEVMMSPTSVGIPNSRLRYFLLAKIPTHADRDDMHTKISDAFPVPLGSTDQGPPGPDQGPPGPAQGPPGPDQGPPGPGVVHHQHQPRPVLYKVETVADAHRKARQNSDLSVRQIQDFLEPLADVDLDQYLLPPRTLLRYAPLLDIVGPTCRRSVCFTKGYGRYVEGTGSVLQSSTEVEVETVFKHLDLLSEDHRLQELQKLKLRYFTPREVANLMGFPKTFSVPDNTSVQQQYRLLGNSLNVTVVSRLLQLLVL